MTIAPACITCSHPRCSACLALREPSVSGSESSRILLGVSKRSHERRAQQSHDKDFREYSSPEALPSSPSKAQQDASQQQLLGPGFPEPSEHKLAKIPCIIGLTLCIARSRDMQTSPPDSIVTGTSVVGNVHHMEGSFRCDFPGCTAEPFQTQYLLKSVAIPIARNFGLITAAPTRTYICRIGLITVL